MMLRKLKLGKIFAEKGLRGELSHLGQVVALFGRNGSGKTRFLSALRSTLEQDAGVPLHAVEANLRSAEEGLRSLRARIQEAEVSPQEKERETNLAQQMDMYSERAERMRNYEPVDGKINVVNLDASVSLSEVGQQPVARTVGSLVEFSTIDKITGSGALTSLYEALAWAAYDSEHPLRGNDWVLKIYVEAQRIVRELMDNELGFKPDVVGAVPTLGSRKLIVGELSPGQQILLRYTAVLLQSLLAKNNANATTLAGAVLLLDEPERHLHPAALAGFVDGLRKVVGDSGQIWIASHSVALLGELMPREIWVMEDGQVIASSEPRAEKALDALLGSEERIARMRVLFNSPSEIAAVEFCGECLVGPRPASFVPNDPQHDQIQGVLQDKLKEKGQVTVIDVGAGRGRLGQHLLDWAGSNTAARIKYIPIEQSTELHDDICSAASKLFPDLPNGRPATRITSLPDRFRDIDVAVLCNVLHEMQPSLWCTELSELQKRVASDGCFLVCEDLSMPVGEAPGRAGYIVLGPEELRVLFGEGSQVEVHQHPRARYRDRLSAVTIAAKSCHVTPQSVRRSVEQLRRRVLEEIRMLRQEAAGGGPASNGDKAALRHAYLAQQHVNCTLALEELPE